MSAGSVGERAAAASVSVEVGSAMTGLRDVAVEKFFQSPEVPTRRRRVRSPRWKYPSWERSTSRSPAVKSKSFAILDLSAATVWDERTSRRLKSGVSSLIMPSLNIGPDVAGVFGGFS